MTVPLPGHGGVGQLGRVFGLARDGLPAGVADGQRGVGGTEVLEVVPDEALLPRRHLLDSFGDTDKL